MSSSALARGDASQTMADRTATEIARARLVSCRSELTVASPKTSLLNLSLISNDCAPKGTVQGTGA